MVTADFIDLVIVLVERGHTLLLHQRVKYVYGNEIDPVMLHNQTRESGQNLRGGFEVVVL